LNDLDGNKTANNQSTQAPGPIITDELKKEAAESVNQVKEIIKNVDIKEEAKNTQGFFKDMIANPIGKIKAISGNSAEFFRVCVVILAIWVAAEFLRTFLRYIGNSWTFGNMFSNMFSIVMSTISPAAGVLVMSAIAYFLLKNKVNRITPVVVVIIIANIPRAVSSVLGILPVFAPGSISIVSPINAFLYAMSVILVYFGLKALAEEHDDELFFKKYVVIQGAYFAARFILGFLNIYI